MSDQWNHNLPYNPPASDGGDDDRGDDGRGADSGTGFSHAPSPHDPEDPEYRAVDNAYRHMNLPIRKARKHYETIRARILAYERAVQDGLRAPDPRRLSLLHEQAQQALARLDDLVQRNRASRGESSAAALPPAQWPGAVRKQQERAPSAREAWQKRQKTRPSSPSPPSSPRSPPLLTRAATNRSEPSDDLPLALLTSLSLDEQRAYDAAPAAERDEMLSRLVARRMRQEERERLDTERRARRRLLEVAMREGLAQAVHKARDAPDEAASPWSSERGARAVQREQVPCTLTPDMQDALDALLAHDANVVQLLRQRVGQTPSASPELRIQEAPLDVPHGNVCEGRWTVRVHMRASGQHLDHYFVPPRHYPRDVAALLAAQQGWHSGMLARRDGVVLDSKIKLFHYLCALQRRYGGTPSDRWPAPP